MGIFNWGKNKQQEKIDPVIVEEVKPSPEELKKAVFDKINNAINSNELFKDGKVFHGMEGNAIAFSPSGNIGVFTYEIPELKVFHVKDVIKMSYRRPQKDQWGDSDDMQGCIINIKDFKDPIIELIFDCWDAQDAKDLYQEINGTYNVLKKMCK